MLQVFSIYNYLHINLKKKKSRKSFRTLCTPSTAAYSLPSLLILMLIEHVNDYAEKFETICIKNQETYKNNYECCHGDNLYVQLLKSSLSA